MPMPAAAPALKPLDADPVADWLLGLLLLPAPPTADGTVVIGVVVDVVPDVVLDLVLADVEGGGSRPAVVWPFTSTSRVNESVFAPWPGWVSGRRSKKHGVELVQLSSTSVEPLNGVAGWERTGERGRLC